MNFELSLALRHLSTRKAHSGLISIITFISILGVVVGVTALIVVLAVMDGAQEDYMRNLIDQYTHIEIQSGYYGEQLAEYRKMMEVIKENPEVEACSPMLRTYAMLKPAAISLRDMGKSNTSSGRRARPAQIMGIEYDLERKVSSIGLHPPATGVSDKDYGLFIPKENRLNPGPGEVVLGLGMAAKTGLRIGDEVHALTGATVDSFLPMQGMRTTPKQYALTVIGYFKSGIYDVDTNVCYVSLATAQDLTMTGDEAGLIHLRLHDPDKAPEVRDALMASIFKKMGFQTRMFTWSELNPALFQALKLEKLAMYVILLLVVLVASLNIIGTLILITMEKTREIGILRAMGVSRSAISRVFVMEGGIIGIIGTSIGIILGAGICWYLKYHCPVDIPKAVYNLPGLPIKIKTMTVVIIAASSMGICLLASVIPAIMAARMKVVEALRHE